MPCLKSSEQQMLPTHSPRRPDSDKALLIAISGGAALLGVSRSTVYNLIKRGELDLIKVGSASRLRVAQLRAMAGE